MVGTLLLVVMAVVTTIVLVIGALILYAIVEGDVPQRAGDGAILPTTSADLALQLVLLGVLTPLVLIVARLIQRRPMGSLASVTGRLRWRWMLLCGGLAIGMTMVSAAMSYVLAALTDEGPVEPPGWAGWGTFLVPAIVIVVLVPFQAAAEEFVFRGWLLQGIAAYTLETRTGPAGRVFGVVFRTPWPAILISAAVFTSGHGYTGLAMLDIFVFGALAGWVAVRTGGLEATIAMHTVNNLVAFLLPAAAGELAGSLKQGGAPWQMVVSDLVPTALYAAAVVALARRRGVRTVTGEPAPAAP
jgi:membrane protease YdiL (CAAX protease family)